MFETNKVEARFAEYVNIWPIVVMYGREYITLATTNSNIYIYIRQIERKKYQPMNLF